MAYGKKDEYFVAQPNPWEINEKRRYAILTDYLEKSSHTSTIFGDAFREGWAYDLMKYVKAVADIQAQKIAGIKNIGWDGMVIFPLGVSKDDARVFLDEQYRIASEGEIKVSIPTGLIRHWKGMAEFRKPKAA